MEAELPWTVECGDESPVLYPALIDPNSADRNYATTGRSMYLYFTKMTYNQFCRQTLDRDLVRVPIEFPIEGAPHALRDPRERRRCVCRSSQAYKPCCSSPKAEHGEPARASCLLPARELEPPDGRYADANGFPANSAGSIRLDTKLNDPTTPEDDTDVKLSATATDVRWAHDFAGYAGELQASLHLRLTDLFNGGSGTDAATVLDLPSRSRCPAGSRVPCGGSARPAPCTRRRGAQSCPDPSRRASARAVAGQPGRALRRRRGRRRGVTRQQPVRGRRRLRALDCCSMDSRRSSLAPPPVPGSRVCLRPGRCGRPDPCRLGERLQVRSHRPAGRPGADRLRLDHPALRRPAHPGSAGCVHSRMPPTRFTSRSRVT